jgi:hypothetical protein
MDTRTGHSISWEKTGTAGVVILPYKQGVVSFRHEWSDSVDDFSGELRQAIACHYGSNNGCYGKIGRYKKALGLFCNAEEATAA